MVPLVRKIERRLETCNEIEQLCVDRCDLLRERAVELVERDSCLEGCRRSNQIGDRLCLDEIPLAVEKRPQSELSRLGQPRASADRAANDRLEHDRTAVRADLHDVLACVGAWSGKIGRDDLVQRVARSLLAGSANVGERRAPCLEGPAPIENQIGDLVGRGSADPNHSDAASARRRRDGDDGVIGGEQRPATSD